MTIGVDIKGLESSDVAGGNAEGYNPCEENLSVSNKAEYAFTFCCSNPTSSNLP